MRRVGRGRGGFGMEISGRAAAAEAEALIAGGMRDGVRLRQRQNNEILWIAATRLRWTWTGLSQASKPTDPMSTEQEPHDRDGLVASAKAAVLPSEQTIIENGCHVIGTKVLLSSSSR
ncbi:Type IV inositol polyphosphate 5-phosphatase 7 [Zea mays]|uniref:Type IV inositol polyphosphate 5-phosphatase 7 n=1 Tax=Zea mays TaxID=4577 RepID=A0A1D6PKE1_MAIZE|nr:Type IV inositol polyphosphate 5-phosphatase 7 [Zea mays]